MKDLYLGGCGDHGRGSGPDVGRLVSKSGRVPAGSGDREEGDQLDQLVGRGRRKGG